MEKSLQERQVEALEEIAAQLGRLVAAVNSTPVPAATSGYGAGAIVRTTDGWKELAAWKVERAEHRPNCGCDACERERGQDDDDFDF